MDDLVQAITRFLHWRNDIKSHRHTRETILLSQVKQSGKQWRGSAPPICLPLSVTTGVNVVSDPKTAPSP